VNTELITGVYTELTTVQYRTNYSRIQN